VICVTLVEQILSVALSFAAGAMIWVVCNDIVPESSSHGNTRLCSVGVIVGFVIMMCLDTALA
jgi:zinc transporter ZupT